MFSNIQQYFIIKKKTPQVQVTCTCSTDSINTVYFIKSILGNYGLFRVFELIALAVVSCCIARLCLPEVPELIETEQMFIVFIANNEHLVDKISIWLLPSHITSDTRGGGTGAVSLFSNGGTLLPPSETGGAGSS